MSHETTAVLTAWPSPPAEAGPRDSGASIEPPTGLLMAASTFFTGGTCLVCVQSSGKLYHMYVMYVCVILHTISVLTFSVLGCPRTWLVFFLDVTKRSLFLWVALCTLSRWAARFIMSDVFSGVQMMY